MRIDVIVGLTASGLIHAGLFLGGILFPNHPPVRTPVEAIPLERFDMPRIEPEKPETIDTSAEPPKPIISAPSMQPDVPQIPTPNGFVQNIQPPLPDGVKPTPGLMTVPPGDRVVGPAGLPVFDRSVLDQQPVARVKTPPPYPSDERRNGISGTVLVDFIVDSDGNVVNATAVKGDNRNFEQAAVQAVSKWKFKPGRKANRAVNTHMQIPIVFSLSE
jgi:protein TonB